MNFKKAVCNLKQEKINIHYFGLYKNNHTSIHYFKNDGSPSDVRSISKTILTLITGIIIENTSLNLETYVYPIIKENIKVKKPEQIKMLKKIKIKHCLNHTLGFDKVLMMRDDIKHLQDEEYLNYIVNEPIIYEPGTYYLYSNAGFYLLSATLQIFLNEDLNIYAKRIFFDPLYIHDYTWEYYGPYLAGATRLWLKPQDLMKIGKLLLHNNGEIVPQSWIEYMKAPTEKTPKQDSPHRLFRRYACAKGLWLAKDREIFFAHGTDSQMLVIIPQEEMVVLAQSEHSRLSDVEEIINQLLEN